MKHLPAEHLAMFTYASMLNTTNAPLHRGAVMSRKVVSGKDVSRVQNLSRQIYSLGIMEKTLTQRRVVNLKWLVTKNTGPFTRTAWDTCEKTSRRGRGRGGIHRCPGAEGRCEEVRLLLWFSQFAVFLDRDRRSVKVIYGSLMPQSLLVQCNQPELSFHEPVSLHTAALTKPTC